MEVLTPSFEVLDTGDAFLGVANHLTEEIGETCPAEFRGAGAVEVPIIDGFAVRWGAELLWSSLGGGRLMGEAGRDV